MFSDFSDEVELLSEYYYYKKANTRRRILEFTCDYTIRLLKIDVDGARDSERMLPSSGAQRLLSGKVTSSISVHSPELASDWSVSRDSLRGFAP